MPNLQYITVIHLSHPPNPKHLRPLIPSHLHGPIPPLRRLIRPIPRRRRRRYIRIPLSRTTTRRILSHRTHHARHRTLIFRRRAWILLRWIRDWRIHGISRPSSRIIPSITPAFLSHQRVAANLASCVPALENHYYEKDNRYATYCNTGYCSRRDGGLLRRA
jgi:hypothetical protein